MKIDTKHRQAVQEELKIENEGREPASLLIKLGPDDNEGKEESKRQWRRVYTMSLNTSSRRPVI